MLWFKCVLVTGKGNSAMTKQALLNWKCSYIETNNMSLGNDHLFAQILIMVCILLHGIYQFMPESFSKKIHVLICLQAKWQGLI